MIALGAQVSAPSKSWTSELKAPLCDELAVHQFSGLARKFDQMPGIKDQEHLHLVHGSEVLMALRRLQMHAASESQAAALIKADHAHQVRRLESFS